MITRLLIVAVTTIASGALADDTVYRCIDEDGNKLFSSTTCDKVGHAVMPDHEVIKQELTRIEQVDRKIAATKREIMDQKREKQAALRKVHTREASTDTIAEDARAVEQEYDSRIEQLSRELVALKEARNMMMERSVTIFLKQP